MKLATQLEFTVNFTAPGGHYPHSSFGCPRFKIKLDPNSLIGDIVNTILTDINKDPQMNNHKGKATYTNSIFSICDKSGNTEKKSIENAKDEDKMKLGDFLLDYFLNSKLKGKDDRFKVTFEFEEKEDKNRGLPGD